MKLLKITGCGDCPHKIITEKIPLGDDMVRFRVWCNLCENIEGFYDTGFLLGTYELLSRMRMDRFIIPGCPLPDVEEEEK